MSAETNQDMNQIKKVVFLVAFIIVFVIGWGVFASVSHSGKVATTVEVLPKDATISMNGKTIKSGTLYLAPGRYSFVAKKSGFADANVTLTINNDKHYVGLLPVPESDDAKNWAQNEDVWPERERIAGARSEAAGEETTLRNPLIDYLPYSDIMGPFSIDYAFDAVDTTKTRVIITNSTPDGRLRALKWIRNQGVDPADLTIEFVDFQNPTNQGDV